MVFQQNTNDSVKEEDNEELDLTKRDHENICKNAEKYLDKLNIQDLYSADKKSQYFN